MVTVPRLADELASRIVAEGGGDIAAAAGEAAVERREPERSVIAVAGPVAILPREIAPRPRGIVGEGDHDVRRVVLRDLTDFQNRYFYRGRA